MSAWVPAVLALLGAAAVAAATAYTAIKTSRATVEAAQKTAAAALRAAFVRKERNTLQWVSDRFAEVHLRSMNRAQVIGSNRQWTPEETRSANEDKECLSKTRRDSSNL